MTNEQSVWCDLPLKKTFRPQSLTPKLHQPFLRTQPSFHWFFVPQITHLPRHPCNDPCQPPSPKMLFFGPNSQRLWTPWRSITMGDLMVTAWKFTHLWKQPSKNHATLIICCLYLNVTSKENAGMVVIIWFLFWTWIMNTRSSKIRKL